jgi:hypothetical protein
MDTGNLIFIATIITATMLLGAFAWMVISIGMRDRWMAAQIEAANLERSMRAMGEADDGRI